MFELQPEGPASSFGAGMPSGLLSCCQVASSYRAVELITSFAHALLACRTAAEMLGRYLFVLPSKCCSDMVNGRSATVVPPR